MDPLKQSVMLNQFMMVTGSSYEEAQTSLKACNWQLESALSMFFQGQMLPPSSIRPQMDPMFAPANTPATPPNFSDALLSFGKLNTGSAPVDPGQNPFGLPRDVQSQYLPPPNTTTASPFQTHNSNMGN